MDRSAPLLLLTVFVACSIPEYHYPPAPPRIVRFSATPFEPAPGAEVLIHYEVEGSAQRILRGGPTDPLPLPEAKGTITLTADQDRTLVLEASGPGGSSQAQTAFRLSSLRPVRIVTFEATPARTYPGAVVRVAWRTQNARRITIDADDGTAWYSGAMPDGTLAIPVGERDLTLSLRADGDQGPVTAQATITIEPRLPLILHFEATPVTLSEGEDLTLRWDTSSARRVVLEEETAEGPASPIDVSNFGNLLLRPNAGLHTFRLRAENEVGSSVESLTVWVLSPSAPEILGFAVTPTISGPGGDVQVSWRVVPDVGDPNVTVTLDPGGLSAPQWVPQAGDRLVPIESSTDLSLIVRRFGSVVDTAQVRVQVDETLPTLSASINTSAARPGEPVSFFAAFTNADLARVEDGTGQIVATTTISPLVTQTAAVLSTTYRVIAENGQGTTTRRFPVYVGEPPSISQFTVDDPFVRLYRSTCFRWDAPGADWTNLSVGGIARFSQEPPVGSGCVLIGDTSGYATLDAVNLAGVTSVTVNFQVLPESFNVIDEEPNDAPASALGPYAEGPIGISGTIEAGGQDVYGWVGGPGLRPVGATSPANCDQAIEVEVREDRIDPSKGQRVVLAAAGGCPTIDARLTPALADLQPPYLFILRRPPGFAGEANYFLVLNSEPASCGDRVVDFGEDCDDGLSTEGGCSGACYLQNDEVEPNSEDPTPLIIGDNLDGYLTPGDRDTFLVQIDLASSGPYRLTVEPTTPDGLGVELSLFDSTRGYFLYGAPLGPNGGASIDPSALYLEAGPYLIALNSPVQNTLPRRGPYRISLTAE